jgi:hypothetical protein
MSGKLTAISAAVYFVASWVLSFITGPIVHNGILKPTYIETASFWRPALMQEPPDMAALLPRWITMGVILAIIVGAFYGVLRPALAGAGWVRGAKFGAGLGLLIAAVMFNWSGVFNLPDNVWSWWAIESFVLNTIAGAIMGWAAGRWAPAGA